MKLNITSEMREDMNLYVMFAEGWLRSSEKAASKKAKEACEIQALNNIKKYLGLLSLAAKHHLRARRKIK